MTSPPAPAPPVRVYMDAVITANRSLSRRGFRVLLGVVLAYNLLLIAFLLSIGAFPVPVFLGLDVLGLYIAFRISYRRGGLTERVRVTAETVQVSRGRPDGEAEVWAAATAFARVETERAGEHEARVRLSASGRGLHVGDGLSPPEREAFAQALRQAIAEARAERHRG